MAIWRYKSYDCHTTTNYFPLKVTAADSEMKKVGNTYLQVTMVIGLLIDYDFFLS